MLIKQLIKRLEAFSPETEIMILDGFNGDGTPRTINFGPTTHEVDEIDAREAADCEDMVGQSVVIIGFGCY